jgi:hypothetical protein
MDGVGKAASDEANIFILRVILQDNKMVGSWLGWGRSNKKFWTKKDALNELMPLLQKSSNDFVKKLKKSAVRDRVQTAMDAAIEKALTENREQLAKLQDNGNEKSMSEETGDGLDDYDKCILDLAIEQEKLTSVVQAEVKRKQANEKDQEVRLQAVSRVSASATSEEREKRQRKKDDAKKEMKSKEKELRTAEFDLELALGELDDDWVMDEERNGPDAVQRVRDRAKYAQARVHRLRQQMQENVLSSDDESTDGSGDIRNILSAQGTQADGDDSQLTRRS